MSDKFVFDVGVINVGYSRTTWTNRALPGVAASDTHKGGGMRCASPSIGTHATNGPTTVPAGDLDPATGQIWGHSLRPLDRPPTPPTARVVALFCVLRGVRCLAGSEPAANERYMTLDGLVAQDSGVPSVGRILKTPLRQHVSPIAVSLSAGVRLPDPSICLLP